VHGLGIVHRDIKPENVFLARTPAGGFVPTLIDFGIAKIESQGKEGLKVSRAGAFLGTPHYVSPEQVRGEPSDARADVWAIGVVLYEMLSGRMPFEGDSPQQVLLKVAMEAAAPLDPKLPIEADLRAVVRRALEHDASRRFASMTEMIRALLAVSVDGSDVGAFLGQRHHASIGPLADEAARHEETSEIASTQRPELSESNALDETLPLQLRRAPLPDDALRVTMRAESAELRASLHPPHASHASHAARPTTANADDELTAGTTIPSVVAAFEALQLNALEDSVALADRALTDVGNDAVLIGKLRLLQANALLWLGRWREAELRAHEAFEHSVPGTSAWLTNLGLRVTIAGLCGDLEALDALASALRGVRKSVGASIPFVVAAARLSTELLRAGRLEDCERWLEAARAKSDAIGGTDGGDDGARDLVDAWLAGVCAELAANEGNVGEALRLYETSASAFGEAGDSRQACRQRGNVGDLLLSLGAYREAEAVLSAALEAAEPMGVYFVAMLRANLGCARFRLGDPAAVDTLASAAAQAHAQGNTRAEAFTRAYLAQALAASDPDAAAREAREACELGAKAPASRAYALAVLAELALRRGDVEAAVGHAREAYRMTGELHGAEGADAFIRVTLAAAHLARGEEIQARAIAAAARDRLLSSAGRIVDPQLRASFLGKVPENARTLELVRSLG
jgi:tetratricopeptide (TPR) repeat protein